MVEHSIPGRRTVFSTFQRLTLGYFQIAQHTVHWGKEETKLDSKKGYIIYITIVLS